MQLQHADAQNNQGLVSLMSITFEQLEGEMVAKLGVTIHPCDGHMLFHCSLGGILERLNRFFNN
jgi:hypothetical protein